jgi:hypothetical protein
MATSTSHSGMRPTTPALWCAVSPPMMARAIFISQQPLISWTAAPGADFDNDGQIDRFVSEVVSTSPLRVNYRLYLKTGPGQYVPHPSCSQAWAFLRTSMAMESWTSCLRLKNWTSMDALPLPCSGAFIATTRIARTRPQVSPPACILPNAPMIASPSPGMPQPMTIPSPISSLQPPRQLQFSWRQYPRAQCRSGDWAAVARHRG